MRSSTPANAACRASIGAASVVRACAGVIVAVVATGAVLACLLEASAPAATSPVTVTVTVPSATAIDATGCLSGTSGVTDFGTVLPNAAAVTGSDCVVRFGSSNDTATLLAAQVDGGGDAMWRPATGSLDQSFDGDSGTGNGLVRFDPTANSDDADTVLVLPDGRFMTCGYYNSGGTIIVRYTATGALDTTFNVTGYYSTAQTVDGCGLARFSDGDVFVAKPTGGASSVFYRMNPDGSFDTSFAGTGKLTIALWGGPNEWATSPVIQPDGKILVVGTKAVTAGVNGDWGVARLNPDGTLDTTFSGDGLLTLPFDGGWNGASSAALETDGDIVISGVGSAGELTVVRLKPDGSLDTTFNGTGIWPISSLSGGTESGGIVVLPNGDYLMAGMMNACFCEQDTLWVRAHPNATLDATFNGTGYRTDNLAPGQDDSLGPPIVLPDGSYMATGSAIESGTDQSTIVVRIRSNGQLDTTFGTGGVDVRDLAPTLDDFGSNLALTTDGRIIVAGGSKDVTSKGIQLIEYDAATISDYAAGTHSFGSGSATSMFGACLRAVAAGAAADTWSTDGDGDCADGDADPWQAIPATNASPTAPIAKTTVVGTVNAVVDLRYGVRPAATQPAGTYLAPVTLTVVAPAL